MTEIRLQKYIADCGVCSRRKAEELISLGKVKLNGEVVDTMGVKVDPADAEVEVEGKKIGKIQNKKVYIMLNKPVDYITSVSSEQGESIMELLTKDNYWKNDKQEIEERVYPVGRLDKESEGLVLLTNDGELTQELTHPKYEHEKEYEIIINSQISKDAKKVLETGMDIGDEFVKGIKILDEQKIGRRVIVNVILQEGKNRQIKKMFGRLGFNIMGLRRIRINKLKLGTLPVGRWRFVKREQII